MVRVRGQHGGMPDLVHTVYAQAEARATLANAQPPRWARVAPPPRQSRRALARAGVMWSPEVQRRATARPWLPLRVRRALSADLAAARDGMYNHPTNYRAPRAIRRGLGAGPWPKLRRRAEAARRARA